MNINTSNSFSVSASSSRGVSGLVSGLDTDGMVHQLLSGTQSKIDKQEGLKKQTEWKQEIYRDVIDSINGLHHKYFDTSFDSDLENNLASTRFFDSMNSSVTVGSENVKIISTDSSAFVGNMRVVVKQLASNAKVTSSKHLSSNRIDSKPIEDIQLAKFDKKVTFHVAASDVSKDVSVNLSGVSSEQELCERLNKAFQSSLSGTSLQNGVTARLYKGRMHIVTEKIGSRVTVASGSETGLAMLGMTKTDNFAIASERGTVTGNMLGGSGNVNLKAGVSFTIDLDGVQKQILLDPEPSGTDGKVTRKDILLEIGKKIQGAFGGVLGKDGSVTGGNVNVQVKQEEGSFSLFSRKGENGHQIRVTGMQASVVGLRPGVSSKIGSNTKLSDLHGVMGKCFSFTINNHKFSFDETDTVGSVIRAVNSGEAGVRMTYSTLSDSFRMETASSGSGYQIEMSQQRGNLLSAMFGSDVIAYGNEAASKLLTEDHISGDISQMESFMKSANFACNVDGKNYKFTVSAQAEGKEYSKEEILKEINSQMSKAFDGDIQIQTDGTLQIKNQHLVRFAQTEINQEDAKEAANKRKTDLAFALGFTKSDRSNISDGSSYKLEDFGISASDAELTDGSSKLSELPANGKITFSEGRLIVHDQALLDKIPKDKRETYFGRAPIVLDNGKMDSGKEAKGSDAIVVVNGVETTRSSNSFSIDGVTMQLNKVSELENGKPKESVISTSRDADSIVKGMKAFVKDYNAMLDKLNGYIDAQADYQKYPPLTDEQKKKMNDREIEKWEEKSKIGLIRRDSNVEDFLGQMRTALYTKPAGCAYALYDIGIETGQWRDKGKLQFNETAFRKALAADPDSVKNLFTSSKGGLAPQLTKIMDYAAKKSSGSPGTLVLLAGIKGWSTEKNNTLTSQIQRINDKIKVLKRQYDQEKEHYWKEFNTMERILSQFNTQSNFLAQQFNLG